MINRDDHQARHAGNRLLAGRVREHPFAAAFKATRMPMIITDPALEDHHPIIFFNAAYETLTSYSSSDVVGQDCRLLQGPDNSPETVTRIREAIGIGEDIAVDILNYRKDGSTFWNALFISSFDMADFTHELVTDLVNAIKRTDVRMTPDLSPVLGPAVKASPLSVIVNELVGDAVGRGLSNGGSDIHVIVHRLNGHFLIRVEDTSDDVDLDGESAKFGRLRLEASARQLGATINRTVEGRRVAGEEKLLVNEGQEFQQ